MSNAAFTDSMIMALSFVLNFCPGFGSSMNTMSEISFCAWSVMPIKAVRPFRLTHSWDGVYRNCLGSMILLLVFDFDKGPLHDRGGIPMAVHFNLNPVPHRFKTLVQISQADAGPDAGAEGTAGDGPYPPVFPEYRMTLARDGPARHPEGSQPPPRPGLFLPDERVLPDKAALRERHGPSEARLERCGGVVELVSVKAAACLAPQRVARPA